MKLRNKKTGEIGHFTSTNWNEIALIITDDNGVQLARYSSLAGLNKEWEDASEEPKDYYCIDCNEPSGIYKTRCEDERDEFNKEIGNYFKTKEEAEKAVEKLKAWKRLEDKGFRPKMWEWEYIYDDNISGELTIKAHIDDATDSDGKYTKDLDLLFGGE